MPHANIWIRKENEKLWNGKIEDKSAWVNRKLQEEEKEMKALRGQKHFVEDPKVIKTPEDAVEATRKPQKGLCEHGQGKKQCFQPKCKNSRY